MTKRVEEALRNPSVRCLSHPKGRYINRRPENALDLERVFDVALEEGVALEVNGLPDRLDLRGENVRDALGAGVRIVCSTDAHSVRGLGNMVFSVATARRGWTTIEGTSDADRARANRLARYDLLTEHVRQKAAELGLATISVDGSRTLAEVVDEVERHFSPLLTLRA